MLVRESLVLLHVRHELTHFHVVAASTLHVEAFPAQASRVTFQHSHKVGEAFRAVLNKGLHTAYCPRHMYNDIHTYCYILLQSHNMAYGTRCPCPDLPPSARTQGKPEDRAKLQNPWCKLHCRPGTQSEPCQVTKNTVAKQVYAACRKTHTHAEHHSQ